MGIRDVVISNLKKERERRKMSQSEFSEFLSIPLSTYKGYEYGASSVPFDVLDEIAERLELDPIILFTGPESVQRVSSRELIELLALKLGFNVEISESIPNNGGDLYEKISLLGENELDLLNKTVDKMLNISGKKN